MERNLSIKTIVAIGIGAAVFMILGRFGSIPTGIPNTNIETSYAFLALMAVLYGPIAGLSIGFIGHALKDLVFYGSPWFSWIIASSVVGLILGIVAALNRNSIWDYLCTILCVLGVSVPSFVVAATLQLYLGAKFKLFPITWGVPLGSDFRYIWTILPSIALSFFTIASVARFTRTELVEVLNSEYIVTAKAKGLSKSTVILKHALRNALIPVITILGPLAAGLLTGSLVVEKVFAVPGIGDLLVNAINTNDLFIISGVAIVYSAFYITVILIVDILYGIIDPRIRLTGGN